jgi:hypothetical protein
MPRLEFGYPAGPHNNQRKGGGYFSGTALTVRAAGGKGLSGFAAGPLCQAARCQFWVTQAILDRWI